jgi:hypothetical protein
MAPKKKINNVGYYWLGSGPRGKRGGTIESTQVNLGTKNSEIVNLAGALKKWIRIPRSYPSTRRSCSQSVKSVWIKPINYMRTKTCAKHFAWRKESSARGR